MPPGGPLDLQNLLRVPGMGREQAPNAPYLPSQEEVAAEAQRQEEEGGDRASVWDILDLPSKVFGGYALKGALKGFAENGLAGAAEGFNRGAPWSFLSDAVGLTDHYAKKTTFEQIRTAFGDTDATEGFANFALNFLGDVFLDPGMFVMPFGLTGEAAAAGTAGTKSLAKAVDMGKRAMLVFKYPLFDAVPLTTNFGLKAVDLKVAQALDGLGSVLRTNPITHGIISLVSNGAMSVPVKDPDIAATIAKGFSKGLDQQSAATHRFMTIWANLPHEAQELWLRDGDIQKLLIQMGDTGGLTTVDQLASFRKIAEESAPAVQKIRADKLLRSDKKLGAAWNDMIAPIAADDMEAVAKAEAGFRKVYGDGRVPIPQQYLDQFGASAREGIEKNVGRAGLTGSEELGQVRDFAGNQTSAVSDSPDFVNADRANVAARTAAINKGTNAATSAIDAVMTGLESGKYKAEVLQTVIDVGNTYMKQVGNAEVAAGVMNAAFDHYFPRVINPEVRQLIEQQWGTFLRAYGDDALNIAATHLNGRNFADLTTLQINALVSDLGAKITNFVPLKTMQAGGQSAVMHVMDKVFGVDFAQGLRKIGAEDAADFFMTNVSNAYWARTQASGRVLGKAALQDHLFSPASGLVEKTIPLNDRAAVAMETQNPDKVFFLKTSGSRRIEVKTPQSLAQEIVGQDRNIRLDEQRRAIAADTTGRMGDAKADFHTIKSELESHKTLGPDSDLRTSSADSYATAQLKRTLAERNLVMRQIEENDALREAAQLRRRGATPAAMMTPGHPITAKLEALTREAEGSLKTIDDVSKQRALAQSNLDQLQKIHATETSLLPLGSDPDRPAFIKMIEDEMVPHQSMLKDLEKYRGLESNPDVVAAMASRTPETKLVDYHLSNQAADLKARLGRIRLNESTIREAAQAEVADLKEAYQSIIGNVSGEANRAREMTNLLKQRPLSGQQMAESVATMRKGVDGAPLLAWDSLTPEQQQIYAKQNSDAVLHVMNRDTANAMMTYLKNQQRADPFRNNSLVQTMDKVTNAWKSWTVGFFPQTRAKEMLSGLMTVGEGGANLMNGSAHDMAWAFANANKDHLAGVRTAAESLANAKPIMLADGSHLTAAEVAEHMQSRGLLGSRGWRDATEDEAARLAQAGGGGKLFDNLKSWLSPNAEKNGLIQAGWRQAQWGSDYVHSMAFVDALERGQSLEQATEFVRNWTYNPDRQLTSFERYGMRRLIPFYGFTKYAARTSVEAYLTNPGSVAWIEKMRQNALRSPMGGGAPIDEAQFHTVAPQFLTDGMGIPYKNGPKGPSVFMLGGYLPFAEVGKMANAVRSIFRPSEDEKGSEFVRYFLQQMNPLLKEGIEQVTNRDAFSGSKIEDYPGQHSELFGVPVTMPVKHLIRDVRLISELDRLNLINLEEMRAGVDAVDRGTKLGSREPLPFAERLAGSAFGITPKTYQVDAVEDLRKQRSETQLRISNLKGKLNANIENLNQAQRDANIPPLIQAIKEKEAEMSLGEQFGKQYGYDAKLANKTRVTLGSIIQRTPGS